MPPAIPPVDPVVELELVAVAFFVARCWSALVDVESAVVPAEASLLWNRPCNSAITWFGSPLFK